MGFKLAGHLGAHTCICKGYIKVAAVCLKVQSMIGLGMVTDKSSSHAMCYLSKTNLFINENMCRTRVTFSDNTLYQTIEPHSFI